MKANQFVVAMQETTTLEALKSIFDEAKAYSRSFKRDDQTSAFINVKDTQKIKIETEIEKKKGEDRQVMGGYTETLLAEMIDGAENESVLNHNNNAAKKSIGRKAKALGLHDATYLVTLKLAYEDKLRSIKNGESNE